MKESKFNAQSSNSFSEENDPLWQLLGEAPAPQPDAWFAVRTMARCRYERSTLDTWLFSLQGMWRQAVGVALGLGLAVGLMMFQMHTDSNVADKSDNLQDAFEIMASVDSSDTDSSTPSTAPSWHESSR